MSEQNKLDEMIKNAATPELAAMYQKAKDYGLVIKDGPVDRPPAEPFKTRTPPGPEGFGKWIPPEERHNIKIINKD